MRLLLTGATLIDGRGGDPLPAAGLLVEDGLIRRIGRAADFSLEPDLPVRDCTGKTIMPGLINCHVHFLIEPYAWDSYQKITTESDASICLRGMENLAKLLASGVTFARDMGGCRRIEFELRNAVETGRIPGPDLLLSGTFLSITGGHCWWLSRQCDGETEFVRGAREQLRDGADLVKLLVTGGYARPKMQVNHAIMPDSPQMNVREIAAVVEEAHARGKKVAAHCNGLTGVLRAAQAGVDSIEHGQFNDVRDPRVEGALRLMADKGIYLVPTLSAFFKNYDKAAVIGEYRAVLDSFALALEYGVKIALGNDSGCPFVGHETAPMEVVHMVEAGMKPLDALRAATANAAELLGVDAVAGTLEPGKNADFLILSANPLEQVTTLLAVEQVYKHGRPVKGGLFCRREG